MRRNLTAAALACIAALIGAPIAAQSPATATPSPFSDHMVLIGPSTVIGELESGAGLPIGGEAEIALRRIPDWNNGIIGLTIRAHTYSSSYTVDDFLTSYKYTLRVTPIAVGAAYHFAVSAPHLDPFVGASLGYALTSYSDNTGVAESVSSGVYLMLDGGVRYFMSSGLAIQGAVSQGSRTDVGAVRISMMFTM